MTDPLQRLADAVDTLTEALHQLEQEVVFAELVAHLDD